MDYTFLREVADSWGLLFMFIVFVSVICFVYRKGARGEYEKYGRIPLKDD